MQKISRNISLAPETDWEIRRLAALWKIPVSQAWARCCHYIGADLQGTLHRGGIADVAALRQAEAKVEMLKSGR